MDSCVNLYQSIYVLYYHGQKSNATKNITIVLVLLRDLICSVMAVAAELLVDL